MMRMIVKCGASLRDARISLAHTRLCTPISKPTLGLMFGLLTYWCPGSADAFMTFLLWLCRQRTDR